jgi:hypothetical protein
VQAWAPQPFQPHLAHVLTPVDTAPPAEGSAKEAKKRRRASCGTAEDALVVMAAPNAGLIARDMLAIGEGLAESVVILRRSP